MEQRCTLRKLELGGVVGRLEERSAYETKFNRLYRYAIRNLMKTSAEVNGLNWESKEPRYVLGTDQLQHSFTEEDLGFLVDHTLSINRNVPVAKVAWGSLGCSSEGVTSKQRQVFPFCSAHLFFVLPSTRKTLVGWSPAMREPSGWSEGQHHEGRGEGKRTGLAQPEEKTGILLLSLNISQEL